MIKLRFSIRDVTFIFIAIGLSLGWWVDRSALKRDLFKSRLSATKFEERYESIKEINEVAVDSDVFIHLIYAFTDPDLRIARAAEKRLCQISGVDERSGSMKTQKAKLTAMKKWIEWYLANEGGSE